MPPLPQPAATSRRNLPGRVLHRIATWILIGATGVFSVAIGQFAICEAAERLPNIVFILADDIGYGDFGCYGAQRVKTPNVDRLAREGIRFTDAHSTGSVCTPTRYAFITGQYAWRNPAGSSILNGEAPLAINTAKPSTASLLRQAGYTTGIVGKWHMGLGRGDLDFNRQIKPGPLEVGFDYAFFFPATGDRVPCVFIENHHVVGLDPKDPIRVSYEHKVGDEPTGREHPEMLMLMFAEGHDATIINGISRIGWMSGGRAARWRRRGHGRHADSEGDRLYRAEQGQAVLSVLCHARHPRAAVAARPVSRDERLRHARRRDPAIRQ